MNDQVSCALREVEEECGLLPTSIPFPSNTTTVPTYQMQQIHLFPVKLEEQQRRNQAAQRFIAVTQLQSRIDRNQLRIQHENRNKYRRALQQNLQNTWQDREIYMQHRKQNMTFRRRQQLNANLSNRKNIDRRHETIKKHARYMQAERRKQRRENNDEEDYQKRIGRQQQRQDFNRMKTTTKSSFHTKWNARVLNAVLASKTSNGYNGYNSNYNQMYEEEYDNGYNEQEVVTPRPFTNTAHYYEPDAQGGAFVPVPKTVTSETSKQSKTSSTTSIQLLTKPKIKVPSIEPLAMEGAIPARPQTAPQRPQPPSNKDEAIEPLNQIEEAVPKTAAAPPTASVLKSSSNSIATFSSKASVARNAATTSATTSANTAVTTVPTMHRPSAPKMHVHGVAGGFKGRALRSPRAITARPKSQSGVNVVGRFQKNVMNKFLNISKNRARVVNRSMKTIQKEVNVEQRRRATRSMVSPWSARRIDATKKRTMVLVGRGGKVRKEKKNRNFVPRRPMERKTRGRLEWCGGVDLNLNVLGEYN